MAIVKSNNVQDVLREHHAATRDKFVVTSVLPSGNIMKREPGNNALAAVDAARKAIQNGESDPTIWWRGEKNESPHYMRHDVYLEQARHPKGKKKKVTTDGETLSVAEKRNIKDMLNQHSQIANAVKQDITGQGRKRLAVSFVRAYLAMATGVENAEDELTEDITAALAEASDEE